MSDLQVDVVAADRTVWSGKARSVVVPAVEGEMGILVGHEPTLAILGAGTVRVAPADGGESVATPAAGGFVSVDSDVVTVVLDTVTQQG